MAKLDTGTLPPAFERGGYVARFAADEADVMAAQRLRHLCFVEAAGREPLGSGLDADRFDATCDHVMIERADGALVCCFRLSAFGSGGDVSASYSAQYYGLSALAGLDFPLVELGRFCVHPDSGDPDVLRIAWGMLASYVDACGAGLLFGCSSFAGLDAAPYASAFDLLAAKHQAPAQLRAAQLAAEVVEYAATAGPVSDHAKAVGQVPPLLKTYLTMGGWVSDHAVVDREMNTLHVFTGLEIAKIPAARAKALRSVARPDGIGPDGIGPDGLVPDGLVKGRAGG